MQYYFYVCVYLFLYRTSLYAFYNFIKLPVNIFIRVWLSLCLNDKFTYFNITILHFFICFFHQVFKWTGDNMFFIKGDMDSLAFGGGGWVIICHQEESQLFVCIFAPLKRIQNLFQFGISLLRSYHLRMIQYVLCLTSNVQQTQEGLLSSVQLTSSFNHARLSYLKCSNCMCPGIFQVDTSYLSF